MASIEKGHENAIIDALQTINR